MARETNTNKSQTELSTEELRTAVEQALAKVAELEKEKAVLTDKSEADDQKIETLRKEALDLATRAANSETEVEGLKAKVSELEESIQELTELNSELQVSLETTPKAGERPTVKHKGNTYSIVYPKINLNGVEITDEQIQANKEIVAELIAMKSGALVLKEEED